MVVREVMRHWEIAWSEEVCRHVDSKIGKWKISTEAIRACLLERRAEWKAPRAPEPGHVIEWLKVLRSVQPVATEPSQTPVEDMDVVAEIEREARDVRHRRLELGHGKDSDEERKIIGEWIARECYYRGLSDQIAYRIAANVDGRLAEGIAAWQEYRDKTFVSWQKKYKGKGSRVLRDAGLSDTV